MIKHEFKFPRLLSILFPILIIGLGFLAVSCNSLLQPINNPVVSNVTPTMTSIPTTVVTATPTLAQVSVLRLWLPPQWDPNSESNVGKLLKERLNEFQSQFPNLPVEVRIKSIEGVGGMLDSLTTASAAAPLALPDLVLLPRPLLETTAQKGILHPLNSYIENPDQDIWYPYAHQLTLVQNTNYGIPFLGDLFLLAYPQSMISEVPKEWDEWLNSTYSLGFNANDPQATVILTLYLLAGGDIQDDQGHPTLDGEILTNVLEDFALAARQGKIPSWVTQTDNPQILGQALAERKAELFYLWSSLYLQSERLDWNILPGFYKNNKTVCLANGWIWASPSPQADRIGIAFQLANFLSEKEFLAKISEMSGAVPTQPAALMSWKNQELASTLDAISEIAQIIPPVGISSVISPALHNALLAVLKDHTAVPQAVSDALAAIAKP